MSHAIGVVGEGGIATPISLLPLMERPDSRVSLGRLEAQIRGLLIAAHN